MLKDRSDNSLVNRRKFLRNVGLAGVVGASLTGIVTADTDETVSTKTPDTEFNPENKQQSRAFVQAFVQLSQDKAEQVFEQLSTEQQQVVIVGLQPTDISSTTVEENQISILSNRRTARYTQTARSQISGAKIWDFVHVMTWSYNGSSVWNIDTYSYISNLAPTWFYRGNIGDQVTTFDWGFESFQQVSLKQCLSGDFGCVDSAQPWSLLRGYDRGGWKLWDEGL
ncbi:hypothetical protein [Halomarina pelagica]|uniref:hypothetical protein n=1 Tax=Halomarina pelagica TaxID=2961599 RepID=UPI0020C2AFCF|nr:hypothetical protein [Halomarina sp. BND7]